MQTLSQHDTEQRLKTLPGWSLINNGLEKDFQFKDFNEAWGFMTRIALLSESMNHHAEYSGVYNKVHLRLSTHEAGGVTEKDIKMAVAVEGYKV